MVPWRRFGMLSNLETCTKHNHRGDAMEERRHIIKATVMACSSCVQHVFPLQSLGRQVERSGVVDSSGFLHESE
eukprot:1844801-Amphidinium_carterae.1